MAGLPAVSSSGGQSDTSLAISSKPTVAFTPAMEPNPLRRHFDGVLLASRMYASIHFFNTQHTLALFFRFHLLWVIPLGILMSCPSNYAINYNDNFLLHLMGWYHCTYILGLKCVYVCVCVLEMGWGGGDETSCCKSQQFFFKSQTIISSTLL